MRESVKAFDRVAGYYDDWYSHPQGRQVFEAELAALEALIPDVGLGLEVGAGTGAFAERLTGEGRAVVCLDPSEAMLARARMRGLTAFMAVGEHLPLRKRSMGFAYMVTTLEFLKDPIVALRQIKAAAMRDASLTILFINADSPWGSLYGRRGAEGDPVFRHARLFSHGDVLEILAEAGYLPQESVGTLTTGPEEPEVGAGLEEPCPGTGVILVKAKPA